MATMKPHCKFFGRIYRFCEVAILKAYSPIHIDVTYNKQHLNSFVYSHQLFGHHGRINIIRSVLVVYVTICSFENKCLLNP